MSEGTDLFVAYALGSIVGAALALVAIVGWLEWERWPRRAPDLGRLDMEDHGTRARLVEAEREQRHALGLADRE